MALQEISLLDLMDRLGMADLAKADKIIDEADKFTAPEWAPLVPKIPYPLDASVIKAHEAFKECKIGDDFADVVQEIINIDDSDGRIPLALAVMVEHYSGEAQDFDVSTITAKFAQQMSLFLAGYFYAKDNADA